MYNIKKSIICIICMLVVIMLPSSFSNAEEYERDTAPIIESPIKVSDFTINKGTVIPGDIIEYSFTITNVGIEQYLEDSELSRPTVYELMEEYGNPPTFYGSDTIYLYWQSSGSQKVVQAFQWSSVDKAKNHIKISGKIPVQKGMQWGEWHLAAIYFEYGDDDFYVKDVREKVYVSMEETEQLVYWYTPTLDFSMADFTVSQTYTDNKAPTLNLKSLKLSRKTIKKKQKSTFSVKVKDSSKIEKVECVWIFYEKSNKSKKYGDSLQYYTMKYNKKTKRYQCSIKFPSNLKGRMQLLGIEVRDIYGNEKAYYAYKRYWDDYYMRYQYTSNKVAKYYNAYKKMKVKKK